MNSMVIFHRFLLTFTRPGQILCPPHWCKAWYRAWGRTPHSPELGHIATWKPWWFHASWDGRSTSLIIIPTKISTSIYIYTYKYTNYRFMICMIFIIMYLIHLSVGIIIPQAGTSNHETSGRLVKMLQQLIARRPGAHVFGNLVDMRNWGFEVSTFRGQRT